MAKEFNSLFSSQNVELFNLLFRHQAYLEGVKGGIAVDFRTMLKSLFDEFGKFLFQSRYQTINAYSKAELFSFIYLFQRAQIAFYSQFTQQLIVLLQNFVGDDVTVSTGIFQAVTGLTLAEAEAVRDHNTTAGYAATQGTDDSNAALWSKATNAPCPANGLLILAALKGLQDQHTIDIVALIRLAYANGWTTQQLNVALLGTDSVGTLDEGDAQTTQVWNTPTGLIAKWLSQATSLNNTIIQHVSAITQSAIASVYFDRYQWVSILDSRTTAICRSRNGNIYVFGEGPLPPAHYNCRSKTIPLLGDGSLSGLPMTYLAWMLTQPTSFQNDLLGLALATWLRSGVLSNRTFQINSTIKPFPISDFSNKLTSILQ